MKRIARPFIATAAGVEFLACEAALACAVCGLDAEPGFLWSMGFLIAMPFAIAAIAGGCFLLQRQARQRERRRGKRLYMNGKERAQ